MKRINKKNKVVHQVTLIIIMSAFNLYSYSQHIAGPGSIRNFAAQLNSAHDRVELNWQTGSEKTTSNYTIQRSADGIDYDDVELIFTQEDNAKETNDYHFADNVARLNSNMFYYRVKIVGMDGNISYSTVEHIEAGNSEQGPTMITRSTINGARIFVSIPDSWQNKTVAFNIYSAAGSLVKGKINSSTTGTEVLNISDLPTGVYTLKMSAGLNNATQNFIKVI